MRLTIRTLVPLFMMTVSGCTTPTGIVVQDPEPDAATEISTVAYRFEQARRTGGMAGVVQSVQDCYRDATVPFTKIWALRECIVLDYAGYRMDVDIGRRILHDPIPYFSDAEFGPRSVRYAKMDGFSSPQQLTNYLVDAQAAVQADLAQLNQNPIIIHHSLTQPKVLAPFISCTGIGFSGTCTDGIHTWVSKTTN